MEAGFFKWSSASFFVHSVSLFFTEENESVGRKTSRTVKSKRVRYLLMKNSTFAQINTQVL